MLLAHFFSCQYNGVLYLIKWQMELKVIYSEKATRRPQRNDEIYLFDVTYLETSKKFGDFVMFLWPFQNIWTLIPFVIWFRCSEFKFLNLTPRLIRWISHYTGLSQAPQFLAKQLTLSQPGGRLSPPPRIFRPCDATAAYGFNNAYHNKWISQSHN